MEMLMAIVLAYWFKNTVVDGLAIAKGQKPPSQERWLKRHEGRAARDKPGRSGPGFGGWASQAWDDAWETWADKSHRRHQRKLAWLKEQAPVRDEAWLEKQRRKADKRATKRAKFADGHGRVWDKTKDKARAVGEAVAGGHIGGHTPAGDTDTTGGRPDRTDTITLPETPHGPEVTMDCPDCPGTGCGTCGGDGQVPAWLADPAVNTHAADWSPDKGTAVAAAETTEPRPSRVRGTAAGRSGDTQAEAGHAKKPDQNRCAYTVGDPSDPAASMPCGNPVPSGQPYCRYHTDAVNRGQKPDRPENGADRGVNGTTAPSNTNGKEGTPVATIEGGIEKVIAKLEDTNGQLEQFKSFFNQFRGQLEAAKWSGVPLERLEAAVAAVAAVQDHVTAAAESIRGGGYAVRDSYTAHSQVGEKDSVMN